MGATIQWLKSLGPIDIMIICSAIAVITVMLKSWYSGNGWWGDL